jgi:Zn-dependent protease with chaperone function
MAVDFDFQRYVERRKGAREAQAREGASYAYAGDLKVLRTLDRLRPVKLALEATERMWRSAARAELLGSAVRLSSTSLPALHALAARAAERLHIGAPTVYVAPSLPQPAATFGTNDEAYLLINAGLVDRLNEAELTDVIGRECAHIQNNHVMFVTALYYLVHFANRFVRWVVTPATLALRGWARRAEITADRGGLLCTRDLGVSEAARRKLIDDGELAERRVAALRLFAESAYFRGVLGQEGGPSADECDARVAEVLSK